MTTSSGPQETLRRSHGGHVYDHLHWLNGPNDAVSLDYIREPVEDGQ